MHFLEWKYMNFAEYFTEFVPKFGIDHIAPLVYIMAWRRQAQAIIWTNDG